MDIRIGSRDVCTVTLDRAVAEELALALAIALGGASDTAWLGKGKGKGRWPTGKNGDGGKTGDGNGGMGWGYGGKGWGYGGKTGGHGMSTAYDPATSSGGKTGGSPYRTARRLSVRGPLPRVLTVGKTPRRPGAVAFGLDDDEPVAARSAQRSPAAKTSRGAGKTAKKSAKRRAVKAKSKPRPASKSKARRRR